MPNQKRQEEILAYIRQKKEVTALELSKQVYASLPTIRRDLAFLESIGLVQRNRGGASLPGESTGEISSFVRKYSRVAEKKALALKALSFLRDGGSYYFDSSTTVGAIIPHLHRYHDLTIITNGLENGILLSRVPGVRSYILGGRIQEKAGSTIGNEEENPFSYHCDAFFFSCHGFTLENGPTEGTIEQAKVKTKMLQRSKKVILLFDQSKWGKTYLSSVCSLQKIDSIIIYGEPDATLKKACLEEGIDLLSA